MEDDSSDQDDDDYSCLAEWQLIQKRLKRVDVSMKCEIRNQLRELVFPESTSLKAPKDKAISKGCPLPPTCLEWNNHRTEEAAAWEYPFMDRQSTFAELLAKQMKDVKKKIITGVGSSKDEPYIF
ncbi:hypothetical protein P8452_65034 [Trifolium repens]|nr:hypothetical protein P8452_65034 [Trifolium repens]